MQSLPSCRRQHPVTLDCRPVIIAQFIGYMHLLVLRERINQGIHHPVAVSPSLADKCHTARMGCMGCIVCMYGMHACSFELQRAPFPGFRTRVTVPEVLLAEYSWARSRMDAHALETVRTHYTCMFVVCDRMPVYAFVCMHSSGRVILQCSCF